MRWKTKTKPEPKLNTPIEKIRFAFLPIKIDNQWVWLENIIVVGHYWKGKISNKIWWDVDYYKLQPK
jgi:hypothetical protein